MIIKGLLTESHFVKWLTLACTVFLCCVPLNAMKEETERKASVAKESAIVNLLTGGAFGALVVLKESTDGFKELLRSFSWNPLNNSPVKFAKGFFQIVTSPIKGLEYALRGTSAAYMYTCEYTKSSNNRIKNILKETEKIKENIFKDPNSGLTLQELEDLLAPPGHAFGNADGNAELRLEGDIDVVIKEAKWALWLLYVRILRG